MKKDKILFICKILVIFLIPSMYTITYLAANNDPYGALDQVPVGIVNLDQGMTVNEQEVNIGSDVANGLIESNAFDFALVSADDFSYDDYFMKITIPVDFTQSIINFKDNDYTQAQIIMQVDESKNYVFSSIAEESLYQMQSEINSEIVSQYLNVGYGLVGYSIDSLNQVSSQLAIDLKALNNDIDSSQSLALDDLAKLKASIQDKSNHTVAFLNTVDAKLLRDSKTINNNLTYALKQLDNLYNDYYSQLETLNNTAQSTTGGELFASLTATTLTNLSQTHDLVTSNVKTYRTTAKAYYKTKRDEVKTIIYSTSTDKVQEIEARFTEVETKLSNVNQQLDSTQANYLTNEYVGKQLSLSASANEVVTFFAMPVVFTTDRENQVNTYGEGLAPFFISLSLYIGALILMTVLPLTETIKFLNGPRIISKLVFYLAFCIGQVLVLFILLNVVNNFSFIHPLIFLGYSFFVSMTFISILMLLTFLFGDIGKFFAFVLLVLQLGGSAGTFPVETLPPFFQAIHPFLPMSYTVVKYRTILFIEQPAIIGELIIMGVIILIIQGFLFFYFKKKGNFSSLVN